MPQCLPSCGEISLGSRTPRLANWRPRRCLHGNQSTSVANPAALCHKKPCQRPPAFHSTRDPMVRRQLWEERNEMNILETTLLHSDELELASSARLTPSCLSTHMWCVCVYIHIYIYIYSVSHELRSLLQESVHYVKLYRYNPKNYIQSWTVTEIMTIEMCGLLRCRRTVASLPAR